MAGEWEDVASSEWEDVSKKDVLRGMVASHVQNRADAPKERSWKDTARDVVKFVRPTVEGLGAVVGGGLGGGAGLLAGAPTVVGAPLSAIAGGVAGSGLGYGIAKTGLDTIEEALGGQNGGSMTDRLLRGAGDVAMGSTYEMGGQAIAPLVGGALRVAKATPKALWSPIESTTAGMNNIAKRSALKRINQAVTKEGPIAARSIANRAEYEALQNEIPGYQVTPASATDDATLIKMQQYLQNHADGAPAMFEGQTMNNRKAIEQYMNGQLPQGSLDDLLKAVEAESAARTGQVASQTAGLGAASKEATSAQMRQLELEAQKRMKGEAARLYDAVDMNMPVAPGMNFGQWKEARSGALNDLRAAQARAASGDASGIMPAQQKVSELENILKRAGEAQPDEFGAMMNRFADPAEIAKLRTANNYYRDTYVPTIRQGQTAKNLATDRTGGFRVDDEISAGKYLQEGDKGLATANDFNRLFGQDKSAKGALTDFARRDLYDVATANGTKAPDLKAAETWIAKRMPALQKLGMDNEFAGFTEALRREADIADFSRVLGQDPQKVLGSLLTARGDKEMLRSVLDLKTVVKGNPTALNGLKRSLADNMIAESQIVKRVGGDPVVSDANLKAFWTKYEPAMKLIYSQDEMAALQNVRKAFEIEKRQSRQISGVDGSPTALNSYKEKAVEKLSPVLSWTGRAVRFAINTLASNKAESVEQFTLRAQYDPQFAKELAKLGDVGRKQGEAAMRREADKWLGRFAAYSQLPNNETTDTQY